MTERAPLSRKLSAIAESATLKVDAKAKALKAEGKPVISYAAGEPDFATPQFIVDAAAEALADPASYRYTPAPGLPALREAIAAKTLRDSGLEVSPAQVIVTNGGKQSVYQAFQAVVNPGDEVLLPAPYWTTYPEAIRLADGTPVEVFAGADQEYKVTVEQLEAARTERTTVLVFVSPSNPTGSVYTAEETKAIGEWALEHGIWIVSDEIYQNLTYEGVKATSIVEAVPDVANQTILVNGVAKTYAMTGWRVGWMVGPADAIKVAGNLQSHLTSNVNNVAQKADDRRAQRPADRGRAVPRGVRPPPSADRVGAVEDRRPRGAEPARRVLRVPRRAGPARPHLGRRDADHIARARRPHPRPGRGRGRPRRGLRPVRLPPHVVRARRRPAPRGRAAPAAAVLRLTRLVASTR
ncbi:aspartate aminotransferase [Microbacterium natoriense]|uniref:Aminotransferase n=1 Tax=Microbacterium natoriense TaxID=284570 RepID=A0AAW8F0L6_9MICO|nr:aspartate aminotransferase [Microbacterium natoriense]